ncbi:MAG: hypothetical protein LBJ61_09765, partial [Deltaproteobacteria bacterium]|nr:hypothetical protein [Deltaproteobacteria bacterium]
PQEGIGLEIYNSNITMSNQGQVAYEFTIDSISLKNIGIVEISNLVLESSYGNIMCPEAFGSTKGTRYTKCYLLAAPSEKLLFISNVTGTIKGKKFNLTNNIYIGNFKPLTLVNMMTRSINTVNCPIISVPMHPLVGTIINFDCEHMCSLTVKLDDGSEYTYLTNDAVREALENSDTVFKTGTKAKFSAEFQQFLEVEYSEPRCFQNGVFTAISTDLESAITNDLSAQSSSCPGKKEPLPPFEGTFVDYMCVDYCHLTVRLDNGLEANFLADFEVQDILNAPNSGYKPGTKVKITAFYEEFFETEFSGGECYKNNVATSISKR